MKNIQKFLVVVLLIGTVLGCLSACNTTDQNNPPSTSGSTTAGATVATTVPPETTAPATTGGNGGDQQPPEAVDYAASVKLDMNADTLKQEVSVKIFVDGDTTHFNVPTSLLDTGVLKARYLGINTPESTGKIEEWGKAASNFTKNTLSNATSIIIESDDNKLNADSTGDRYLVWVWYKTADSEDYRNLNIEILQNGLAIASSSANNRYGSTCMAAINQAKSLKLAVHSDEKDPDFYYGEAQVLTLKELRCNIAEYNGTKVAFTGIITVDNNNGIYVESYDEETNLWYGIYVYYGFGMNGNAMEILSVGNESLIIGTVSYYEAGGSYQVSGLSYRAMKPDDPSNIKKLSDGHTPAYPEVDPTRFASGKVNVSILDDEGNGYAKSFRYAELSVGASISMKGLKVTRVSTTTNEDSSQYGAMTLTCEADGVTIKVRTTVFRDENGDLITADYFRGKTIDVRGIVDFYMDDYQIKVFSLNDITVK